MPKGKETEAEVENMSLAKELEEVKAKNMEIEEALEKANQEVQELQGQITDSLSAMEAVKEANDQKLVENKEIADRFEEEKNAAVSELEAAKAENESLKADLEKAKNAMSNPAFVDAAIIGENQAVEILGESGDEEKVSHYDEYMKIDDPTKRSKYWNEHEDQIKEEIKESYSK